MKNLQSQEIHTFLIEQKEFLLALQDQFDENEIQKIIHYAKDISGDAPEIMDDFYDWFHNLDSEKNILCIGWDSNEWGAGGSGFISFELVFGLARMKSSDYEKEEPVIFNKETFSPFGIESLMNDYIDITSDVYTNKELQEMAEDMGMESDTVLTINGKEIKRRKRK